MSSAIVPKLSPHANPVKTTSAFMLFKAKMGPTWTLPEGVRLATYASQEWKALSDEGKKAISDEVAAHNAALPEEVRNAKRAAPKKKATKAAGGAAAKKRRKTGGDDDDAGAGAPAKKRRATKAATKKKGAGAGAGGDTKPMTAWECFRRHKFNTLKTSHPDLNLVQRNAIVRDEWTVVKADPVEKGEWSEYAAAITARMMEGALTRVQALDSLSKAEAEAAAAAATSVSDDDE